MASLRELAAEQVRNSDNPYLRDLQQQDAPTALGQLGLSPSDIGVNAQTTTAPTRPAVPEYNPATMGPITGTPSNPPVRPPTGFARDQPAAAPAQPQAAPRGPAPESAERTGLRETEAVNEETRRMLEQHKASIADQQQMLSTGAAATQAIAAQQAAQDKQSAVDLAGMQIKATADAAQRDAVLERDRQALRAEHPDPQRWWKDKGVAGQMLGAIAMAAGAYAAAMPHAGSNQNMAAEIIQRAVQKDVDAQQAEIEGKWKAIDFKADANTKAFARDQFMAAQKRQAAIDAHSNAGALIDTIRAGTTDAVKAKGLDDLKTQNDLQIQQLKQDDINHRVQVMQHEQAQAAAAAAAERKQAVEKDAAITKLATELHKDPNFQPTTEGMAREEAALRSAEAIVNRNPKNAGLATVSKAGPQAMQGQAVEDALTEFGKSYEAAAPNATEINRELGNIVPGGTRSQDAVNQVNAQGAAILKSVEGRLPQEEAERVFDRDYALKPYQSKEQQAARLDAFRKHVRQAVGVKGRSPGDSGEVPGATEVE